MDWATARPVASAAIAQLVEHFIRNEKVVGSSPTRGSNIASWESIKHKDWFPVSFLLIYIAVR